MKAIILLALVLVATNSNLWDDWFSNSWVPTPSTATSQVSSFPGWSRNGPNNVHSQYFNDFSQLSNQFMYWNSSDYTQLIFCSPKYYLHNLTLCKKDPYYYGTGIDTYCIPNTYNNDDGYTWCDGSHPLIGSYQCCYWNLRINNPPFERNYDSVDSESRIDPSIA